MTSIQIKSITNTTRRKIINITRTIIVTEEIAYMIEMSGQTISSIFSTWVPINRLCTFESQHHQV